MSTAISIMTAGEVDRCQTPEGSGFGALETPRGVLPLQALDVKARIDGLLAQVTVRQTFVNVFDEPLEATYIFPLPDRAAVTAFRMEVAGRVIDGALRERGEARREYDAAIQAGHRAAITEEERPDVFNLRVGNLMPGEQAVITLTLVGPLQLADNEATFRFPLVVAPRYIPGVPLPGASVGRGVADDTDAVPDASRITPPVLLPGFSSKVALSIGVDVHAAGLKLGEPRCSLHTLRLEGAEPGVQRLRLQPDERLDRDFILRFQVGGDSVQTSLALAADPDGKQGTFLLTLVPPAAAASLQRPRDVVFILDRSGSMAGWKMVAARRALGRMVDTLGERDRFNVLAFDDRVETPPAFAGATLVSGSDRHRFRAVEFLATVDSRGGTELAQPLMQAVQTLAAGDPARERILILVTDGQVGNEDQLLKAIGPQLHGLRVFTLGIDQAVNAGFLQRLAQLGGGACELVESEDRLDEVMTRVHRRIGTPVVADLNVKPANLRFDTRDLVPARLPDLFAGTPVFILGRYQRVLDQEPTLVVAGKNPAGKAWSQTIAGQPGAGQSLNAAWARGRIRDLEDLYAIAASRDLERQIVELSLGCSVLSRFTAYVAVDRAAIVNAGGRQHQVTQPVEVPAGWEMEREARQLAELRADMSCAISVDAEYAALDLRITKKAMLAKQASGGMSLSGKPVDSSLTEFTDKAIEFTEGDDAAVAKLLELTIEDARARNASEIRIVPELDRLQVYYLIEGKLEERDALPMGLLGALARRIKLLAGLDPAKSGIAQTGRIDLNQPGLPVWLEVVVTPTPLGDAIVLKLAGSGRERFWA